MTHTGLQRSANQDAFVVDSRTFSNLPEYGVHTSLDRESTRVLAICDGMGGHAGGEIAAQAVAEAMSQLDRRSLAPDQLTVAIQDINRQIYDQAASDDGIIGMGSTLVSAVFWEDSDVVTIANVGDSLAFLVDVDGRINTLSVEQEDERGHLLHSLGGLPTYTPVAVASTEPLQIGGGTLLMCSDGVTDILGPEQLAKLFSFEAHEPICTPFVSLARLIAEAGAHDNLTLMAIRQVVEPVERGRCIGRFAEAFQAFTPAALAALTAPTTREATRHDHLGRRSRHRLGTR